MEGEKKRVNRFKWKEEIDFYLFCHPDKNSPAKAPDANHISCQTANNHMSLYVNISKIPYKAVNTLFRAEQRDH